MRIATLVVWSVLLAGAAPAFAQDQGQAPESGLDRQKYDELAKWLKDYHAWQEWFERWGNRIARNYNNDRVWTRKERPEPPVWLENECRALLPVDGMLPTACHILRKWDEEPLLLVQRRHASVATSGGQVNDQVVKSSFFQRVHLTGLWIQARIPSSELYGIIGMQVAVVEVGRYTLPAAGVMLVMMPDGRGGHEWKPATTLGFGFRLVDFVPPFAKKEASLHINVARTNIHGMHDERLFPGSTTFNFVGLSVSQKKRR